MQLGKVTNSEISLFSLSLCKFYLDIKKDNIIYNSYKYHKYTYHSYTIMWHKRNVRVENNGLSLFYLHFTFLFWILNYDIVL